MNGRQTRLVLLVACLAVAAAGCAPQGESPEAAQAATPPTMKMTTDIPVAYTAPDKVETSIGMLHYFDGVPSEKSTEAIYDYLDTSRAVNVYLNSVPALSANALREGQAAMGADTCNKICIWDSLMDSKTILLTGNTSTMYAVGFLDLLQDGPTVIDLPPGMLGILDDMAFHYMVDLGVAGPDKGKGGKYLVLPPGYKGDIPKGYFVVQSKTSGVWVFMRGYLDKSLPIEQAVPAASKNIRNTLKVYPLATRAKPAGDGVHQRVRQGHAYDRSQ